MLRYLSMEFVPVCALGLIFLIWCAWRVALQHLAMNRIAAAIRKKLQPNTCPVCGFGMQYSASDWNICPSCGVEFNYDDANVSHAELRSAWIRNGCKWWCQIEPPPVGWNPQEQLRRVNKYG